MISIPHQARGAARARKFGDHADAHLWTPLKPVVVWSKPTEVQKEVAKQRLTLLLHLCFVQHDGQSTYKKTHHLFFECFPYVRPEPVLVK